MKSQVFFITGTSSGLGFQYAQACLSKGDKVVATARHSSNLQFDGSDKQNLLLVDCDVTSEDSVNLAFDKALSYFGRIDVVVNNAGYGLVGEFESLSDAQIRQQMEVNFFGVLTVTRRALEIMREGNPPPRGGRIQQITSIGGQCGFPTGSAYCASKWAVEGFSEAVAQELKPEWDIWITCIEPGGFRTDVAGRSKETNARENKNLAYDHIDAEKTWDGMDQKQPGDPRKGAIAMREVAKMEKPPMRIVLGNDAYTAVMEKVKRYSKEYVQHQALAASCQVE